MQNEERPPDADYFTYVAAAKYFDPDTQQLDLSIVDALTDAERAEFIAFVCHTIGYDIAPWNGNLPKFELIAHAYLKQSTDSPGRSGWADSNTDGSTSPAHPEPEMDR